jgi:hypothetical protein
MGQIHTPLHRTPNTEHRTTQTITLDFLAHCLRYSVYLPQSLGELTAFILPHLAFIRPIAQRINATQPPQANRPLNDVAH